MTFDPRDWTVQGYLRRYGYPNTAIERLRRDCLTGIDSATGKPLSEIEPRLRRFVCAQYMAWIHHLIKESVGSLKTSAAYPVLETLYYGCPEVARRVESVISDLAENVEETEEGNYVLKGMTELEQRIYLDNIIKELYTKFMEFLRDKLGDFYYEVQDYFIDRCVDFGISPLPEKLPRPKGEVSVSERAEKPKNIEELTKKLKELSGVQKIVEREAEEIRKEIEDIKNKIESEMRRILEE
jgi:hypothetical protein